MPKQSVAVEIFYGGVWHDAAVEDKVFIDAPVTITRGQGEESPALRPAQIKARLDNQTDKYRTSNPASPLYGLAGRNTPTRVKIGGTIRGTVEASSWAADETDDFSVSPPRGKAWVDIEGGGLLQRVNQWTELVSSTMVKGMKSFGAHLVGAWPLEDASTSTILSNLVSGGAVGEFTDCTLGDAERPAGSARSVKLGTTGHIFSTCLSSAASGWQMCFAFRLPALPGSATYAEIFSWYDSTGRRWTWETNNTNYAWTIYAPDGSVLANVGSAWSAGREPNQWIRARMKVSVSGGTITYEPAWYAEGSATIVGATSTFAAASTGCVTRWGATAGAYNTGAWYTGVFAVDDPAVVVFNAGVVADFNGHAGETAGDRFARLTGDLGLAYTVLGATAKSALMGGQPEATYADLLKEIIATDDALLFDDIDSIGLVLMLRNARYNQTPALALTVTDLPYRPREVADDQSTHNVVTASQRDGGQYTATDSTGPLGTLPPPAGVGEAKQTVDVNVFNETTDLFQQANWWLRRGTVNLPRYPQVAIDLNAKPALIPAVETVDVGSVITISGFRENTVRLMVIGWTETVGSHTRDIVFTCVPDQQFQVGVYGTNRYDLQSSVLNAAKLATDTAMTFKQTVDEFWSNTAVPYDIMIAGERMTVTAMGSRSGSGPWLQAATVIRAVNGISKPLAANEPVHRFNPGRYAL